MNYQLASSIVDLLAGSPDFSCSRQFSRFGLRDWEISMFWLDASGLALLVEDRIRRDGLSGFIPEKILARLQAAARNNRGRTEAMLAEFARLCSALETAEITFAVLKGFSLVPDYCRTPTLRLQIDLDFLISPEQIDPVSAVMTSLGYELVSRLPFEVRFASGSRLPRPHADLYLPPASFVVEFHFGLVDRPEFSAPMPHDALQRRCWSEQLGIRFPTLAKDDQFLHHSLHAFQDVFMFSLRVSSLFETATFLRISQFDDVFWQDVERRVLQWDSRIGDKLGLILALAVEVCGAKIPRKLSAWTVERCSPRILLWVRRYGRRWCLHQFPGSKLSILLASEFMDRRTCLRFARNSLAPRFLDDRGGRQTSRKAQHRSWSYTISRAVFHLREAIRLAIEYPAWLWARRAHPLPPVTRRPSSNLLKAI